MKDDVSLELKLARQARDEAAADRKAAAADLEAARYEHEMAERRHRDVAELEANISRREAKLKELSEPEFVAREKAADAKLKEAQELVASVDKEKHAAAINFNRLIAREDAERAAAGIGS
jgi:hypothetical protein